MTRANEYRAYFTLVGEFNPGDISERLGLPPSRSWRKGDTNDKTQLERKFSRWCIDSRLDQTAPLEEQVEDVLAQLEPVKEQVAAVRKSVDGVMQLVAYFYSSYPGLHFDEALIARLAALNLGINCDFYYLYSDRREDSINADTF